LSPFLYIQIKCKQKYNISLSKIMIKMIDNTDDI